METAAYMGTMGLSRPKALFLGGSVPPRPLNTSGHRILVPSLLKIDENKFWNPYSNLVVLIGKIANLVVELVPMESPSPANIYHNQRLDSEVSCWASLETSGSSKWCPRVPDCSPRMSKWRSQAFEITVDVVFFSFLVLPIFSFLFTDGPRQRPQPSR